MNYSLAGSREYVLPLNSTNKNKLTYGISEYQVSQKVTVIWNNAPKATDYTTYITLASYIQAFEDLDTQPQDFEYFGFTEVESPTKSSFDGKVDVTVTIWWYTGSVLPRTTTFTVKNTELDSMTDDIMERFNTFFSEPNAAPQPVVTNATVIIH